VTVIDDEDGETVSLPELPGVDLDPDTTKKNTAVSAVNESAVEVMVRLGMTPAEIAEESADLYSQLGESIDTFFDDGDSIIALGSFSQVDSSVSSLEGRDKGKRRRRRCRILAGLLRPFVRLAARRFEKKNGGPGLKPKTTHMFFLYPLHRPLFDAGVDARIWFKAKWVVARFWANVAGVTFGKRVYIRDSYVAYKPKGSEAEQNSFFKQTDLLAHEFEHVQQYRKYNFSIKEFAWEYIYRWCRAGKSYSKNPMELGASAAADKLRGLLWVDRSFFKFWHRDGLRTKLGYPVETSYRTVGSNRRELKFQTGAMEMDTRRKCYRIQTAGGWGSWVC
jgi:hypothetical protein